MNMVQRRTILSLSQCLLGLAFPLCFQFVEQRLILHLPPLYNRLVFLTVSLLNVCTGTTAFPQLSSQCPILEKLKLCFLNISAGLTV